MDGMDLSTIDQLDQDAFCNTPDGSDDCEEDMPMPDCIGVDSALQDDEEARLNSERERMICASKSSKERELELKVLKHNSIRRQILERSLVHNNESSSSHGVETRDHPDSPKQGRSHVMNIAEKAGMSGIDKDKINRIIHEASKGSLFYRKQAQRQAEIHKSIERMLNRVKAATPIEVEKARLTCDKIINDLETHRTLNKVIVHFDLDMFFAAVEIRDNPSLKDKPVAVGGESMVSTSNYIARRFGVRAAMPGFIAKKLCPELILIKPNGVKYRQASSEVFSILERYDPDLTSMSLDEAYLDITEYVKNTLERDDLEHEEYYDGTLPKIWWSRASEIVEEIRQAIFDKTQLTCSAGIACNALLAKISTDINKPNGQFMVEGYRENVLDFISKTPIEKVSGIGKVSAQFLNALEIKTCGDILEKRQFLPLVFYEINVKFYLRVALGDGSTSIRSDEQRKSKSVERTFPAVKDTLVLLDKLDGICEELCSKYLKPYRIRGRTVTLKLKRNTFTTTTKSYSMLVPTNDKLVIYSTAKNLLLSEVANEPPEISYRLLGVKISNLADDGVTTNQLTIDAMLRNQELSKTTKSENSVHRLESPQSEMSLRENDIRPELITQEDPILIEENASREGSKSSENEAISDKESTDGSQKRSNPSEPRIESFFKKRIKTTEDSKPDSPREETSNSLHFISQEENEAFFDAASDADGFSEANRVCNEEQQQSALNSEDYPCPYCFKQFADFDQLESHVNNCRFKTSIDVNKSFFSQKSSVPLTPVSSKSTQIKSSKSKSTSKRSKDKQPSKHPKQASTLSSPNWSASSSIPTAQSNNGSPKLSFYQRFIESNSHSLSQSVKLEPFQCPYCYHGFLTFPSLEVHAVMCTKRKSN
jgi:nucleotidyltransferase/DNA polymerase involved in DNA repair